MPVFICVCYIWTVSDQFCIDLSATILHKNLSKFHLVAQAVNCDAIRSLLYAFDKLVCSVKLMAYIVLLLNNCHYAYSILPSSLLNQWQIFKVLNWIFFSTCIIALFEKGHFGWFKRQDATITFMTSSAISVVSIKIFIATCHHQSESFFLNSNLVQNCWSLLCHLF